MRLYNILIIRQLHKLIRNLLTFNLRKVSYKSKHGQIRMILKLMKEKIVISIFDSGSVFEPDKIPLPDFSEKLSQRSVGGLGLFLMKQFMDEVNFYFKGSSGRDENEVRMVKYIK